MAAKSELVEDNISRILYMNKCGYKTGYLVEKLREMERELIICPQCRGIMRNACIDNDETKCENCIKFVPNYAPTYSNRPRLKEIKKPAKQVRNAIDKIMIKCPLLRECNWKGKLSEAKDHLSKCEQFLLKCPLKCNEVMPRAKINEHMKEDCPMRKVSCVYCNTGTFLAKNLTKHHESCANYIVICNFCTEEIERRELTNHHNTTCGLFVLNCSHSKHGCKEKLERRNIEEHVTKYCLLRKVVCAYCDIDIFAKNLTDHHETCPNYIITCPQCAEEMKRCELDNHQNTTCELFVINCPFSKYGCEEKFKRKDIAAHKKELYIEHQNMIVTDLEVFKEEMDKENKKFKQELCLVRDEMKFMKRLYKIDLKYNVNPRTTHYVTEFPAFHLDECKCKIIQKRRLVGYNIFLDFYMLRLDNPSWNTDYPIYITECRLVMTREDGTLKDYFNSLSLKHRVETMDVGCRNFFLTLTPNIYQKYIQENWLNITLYFDYKNILVPK